MAKENTSSCETDTWDQNGSEKTVTIYGNGCQTDPDASLVLMGHRYYDPRIGRFLSQDPIGDGNNWYTYAENNPVNNTDPLGLFDTTGMNFTQIYNEADREGGTGSVRNNTDANGYTSQFTVTTNGDWGTIGGVTMHIPNGEDIGRNIGAARQFMASKDSHSQYSLSRNGYGPKVSRHDPKKVKAWLVAHVGNDDVWDYKHRSKDLSRYDEAGHVNYAAVASELRIDLTTIIVAQQVVHEQKYGLTAMPEGSSGEVLGYHYDQQTYNPGPALFSLADMWP